MRCGQLAHQEVRYVLRRDRDLRAEGHTLASLGAQSLLRAGKVWPRGVRSYTLLRTEYRDGSVYAHLQKKRYARCCAACQHPGITMEGCAEVKVRTLPIGKRSVFFIRHLHRLRCHRCGRLKQEPRDIAAPRKSYSLALARLVLDLCQQMTLSAVAQYLQLNWHVCKDILLSDLRRKKERLRLRHVRRIAIDEIFVRSPHHFLTVVVDLDSGQVLYVGVGKDRSAEAPFFAMLRAARAKLQASLWTCPLLSSRPSSRTVPPACSSSTTAFTSPR